MVAVQDKLDAIEQLSGYVVGSLCICNSNQKGAKYEYMRTVNSTTNVYYVFYGFTYDSSKSIEEQTVTSESQAMLNTMTITDGENKVDIISSGGVNYLATQTQIEVTVEELLGKDNFPDTFFKITNAGAVDDTIKVQIPDASVDKTSTLTATEVGDTEATATLVKNDLNADENFNDKFVAKSLFNVVFIEAKEQGERYEYDDDNDFQVSATGTTTIQIDTGFDKIIRRSKKVVGEADDTDPRNIRLGIYGEVGSRTKAENPINISTRKSLATTGEQIFCDETVPAERIWYIGGCLMANDLASEMTVWQGYMRDKVETWEADGTLFTQILDYGCLKNSAYHIVKVNDAGTYVEGSDYVIEPCPTNADKSQLRWIKSQTMPAQGSTVKITYDAVIRRLGLFVQASASQPYTFEAPLKLLAGQFIIATVMNKSANAGVSIVNLSGFYEEI